MPDIHPTAVIDSRARLAEDVSVGPYCVIGPEAVIGSATQLGVGVVVEGRTAIGHHNRIGHYAMLGQEPQDLKYRGETTTLEIGNHNDIREHCTLHLGTENGGGSTTLGDHNLLMVGAHVAHDSHIANHCMLANNVLLAGHVIIRDYANIGGGTAITQYVTVGRYAYIGGLSGVVHDCPPFMTTDGHPARVRSVNTIGLTRHGFDETALERLKTAHRSLYARNNGGNCADGIAELYESFADDPHIKELCDFISQLADVPNGRYAEIQRRDDKRTAPTR